MKGNTMCNKYDTMTFLCQVSNKNRGKMKVKVIWDLKKDKEEFKHFYKGVDYYLALWDISQDLFRKRRKYGKKTYAIEELETEFYEILKERSIEL